MNHAQPALAEITVTLPDGSTRAYASGTTGEQVAASIGAGLAKAAVAMKVDGVQRDLYLPLTQDVKLQLLTAKDEEGIEIIRHTLTAQLLARAVKELFPGARLAIGPTIDYGFYYDVALDTPLTPDDLPRLEAKMHELLKQQNTVTREMWPRDKAIAMFEARGEGYKAELIRLAPEDDTTERGKISLYRQGSGDDAFIDLCRGPHVPNFAKINAAFKLTRISGAYWRGDAKNEMLQRIYGIAFATEKELKAHLLMLEEAEKRDHRKLGRELDLFHIQEEATGQVFWHDKGWTLYRTLENFIRTKLRAAQYIEVKTPILVDRILWEKSGHWEKFHDHMFISSSEEKTLCIKPMNCPCHVQIFNVGIKSYRDLPLRMAEFGSCHRNEPSGALHGLMRVRGFTQDDAHIFCTEDQITAETVAFCDLLKEVYRELGFAEVKVKFSDRPETRAGSDATWDKAENALKEAVGAAGLEWTLNPGEGAFYGPKLEFVLRDAIGRDWQCGTLQVDFVLPERLDANYVGEDGQKHRPVMLHRAILGSFERFIGILIEQYAGKFPAWLAPTQAVVCSITNEFDGYAQEVLDALKAAGVRAEFDNRAEKINYKVRDHSLQKIPYIIAVGGRDAEGRTVALRTLGSDGQQTLALDVAVQTLVKECSTPN
ncbi:MAG: threonine--tRNA ligase [Alphaproteobacteria bacterium]|nr:threonine--tRNA ligase [Alphaproteobacteria bacterium]